MILKLTLQVYRDVVVVVVVWLEPLRSMLEPALTLLFAVEDVEEEAPKELVTVERMKGVNWAMILATRSPSFWVSTCCSTTFWTTGATCWTTFWTGAGAGTGAGFTTFLTIGLARISTKFGWTVRVSVYPIAPAVYTTLIKLPRGST